MNKANNHFILWWKDNGYIIVISLAILLATAYFHETLYGIFGADNYLSIHLLMEFFIITIAFVIAIQTWMVFPHVLSSYRLWLGAVFFAIGLFEIAHTMTYKGMPFFLMESSAYKATWFFLIGRLTLIIALLAIVLSKDREAAPRIRWYAYSGAFLFVIFWAVIIFHPESLLPDLVQEGIGTTSLKNTLQYIGITLQLLIIFFIIRRFRTNEVFNYMLIIATVFLMISDYAFTTYVSVYDINNFTGHLFQLIGFYFMQRAVYHTAVLEPFQKQKEVEEKLQRNQKFLKTIATHMGEGLIAMDQHGKLTYMNKEAQRLLIWSFQELKGSYIHGFIHKHKESDKCPAIRACREDKVFRVEEDYFHRKDGQMFPVSYVATPFYEDGQVMGSILVFRDISQQKRDREMIHFMAFHDELTQLPNLRYLKQQLAEILGSHANGRIAVIVLDIDRFKNMNEALGHAFGDMILHSVAERMVANLSNEMILGRLSGDEFAIVISFQHQSEIDQVMETMEKLFKEPLPVQHLLLNITVTMGVAIFPDHGNDADKLLQLANTALMEAQQNNSLYHYFQPSMDGKAMNRLVLENDLYHAIERNELYLVYQPQVNIETGEIVGLEALIRWEHPTQGSISPAEFIPLAEETGLIIPIGEWVLQTACRQMKSWHDAGLPALVIAVNLSIRQFYQQNLDQMVADILQESGLRPEYLELEITESMMMNVEHTMTVLHRLKELGVYIAIDDFGTGYSSLSYLKHLPIDRLKIDGSFVRDLLHDQDETTIVSTIISLARHMNLDVIAEGVETLEQMEVLQRQKCHQVQGYLYSPPLPAQELTLQFASLQEKVKKCAGAS